MPPECPHIMGERLQGMPDNEWGQCLNCGHTEFVSTPDSKGHAMPLQTCRVVGLQNHVGGGIVRGGIHGIGPGKRPRRGEANVIGLDINNGEHQMLLLLPGDSLEKSSFLLMGTYPHDLSSPSRCLFKV